MDVVVYGFDTDGDDTECVAGPYEPGQELVLVVKPTKAHRLLSLILSDTMSKHVRIEQVHVGDNQGGDNDGISVMWRRGTLTLRPGLRVRAGDRVGVTLQVRKRTKRVCITARGSYHGPN